MKDKNIDRIQVAMAFEILIRQIMKKYPTLDDESLFAEIVKLYYEVSPDLTVLLSQFGIHRKRIPFPIPHLVWEKEERNE